MIKQGVNDNQTIENKNLYICYDSEDINQRYKDNKIKRHNFLKNLNKMENDKIFQIKKPIHKITGVLLKRNNSQIYNKRYELSEGSKNIFNVDKNIWFLRDKNNNFK